MTDAKLCLILGDQLSPAIATLSGADKTRDRVLMVEVMEEATYVRHHKKKIAFILSAMRHFAEELAIEGWTVDYVRLDDPDNTGSFTGEVQRALSRLNDGDAGRFRVVVTAPGEWRVAEMCRSWTAKLGVDVDILADDRNICSEAKFREWAGGRNELRMEHFYREMRRATGLLMRDDGTPEGERWNFDADNRKAAEPDLFMPTPHRVEPDAITREVLALVADRFADHFGDLEPFWFAVTRAQAEAARDHFLATALARFGDVQDAMLAGEKYLYHSVLSPYINVGLLDPLDLCHRAEAAYQRGDVALNSAEGFIRQIIGWREYVRGIYWLRMPDYVEENFFGASRDLPWFYWSGETDLACLAAAIGQTREEAYAHHIQRLMLTGNFAMLIGADPYQVHEWYLAVYADAFEWVELPNTLGMSQFADGGLLGSKPYAGGGNYINKMSDYCSQCRYDVKKKTGPNSCPFNSLYWDFLVRNRNKLKGNSRLRTVYATWDRMSETRQKDYRRSARDFLAALDE